jgi:zinc protease
LIVPTKAGAFAERGKVIKPDKLSWILVGDRSKIEAPLKELGYEIKLIDGDGNLIQ